MESSQVFTMTVQEKVDASYKHEICEVFELAAKHGLDARFLELQRDGPIHEAIFNFRLTVGRFIAEAQGPTKVIAKTQAAHQILPDLRSIPLPQKMLGRNSSKKSKLWRELPTFQLTDNPVSCLHEIVTKCRGKPAEYTVDNVDRTIYPWVLYIRLTVAGETVIGAGHSKKEAQRNAASKMLNRFGYSFLCVEPDNTQDELLLIIQDNSAPITQEGCLEVKHKDTCPEVSISQSEDVQPLMTSQDDTSTARQGARTMPDHVLPDLAGRMSLESDAKLEGPLFSPDSDCDIVPEDPSEVRESTRTAVVEESETVETVCVTAENEPDVSLDDTYTLESDKSRSEGEVQLDYSQLVDAVPQEETETVEEQQSPEANDELSEEEEVNAQLTHELQELLAEVHHLIGMASVNPAAKDGEDSVPVPGRSDSFTSSPDTTDVNIVLNNNNERKRSAGKRTRLTIVIGMARVDPAAKPGENSVPVPGRSDLFPSSSEHPESCVLTNAHQAVVHVGEDSVPVPGRSDLFTSSSELPESCVLTNVHQPLEHVGEDSVPVPGESDLPTSSSGRPVSFILCHALVKKVFKLARSQNRQDSVHMAMNLNEMVKELLIDGREWDISLEDLQKIGKTAAKQLVLEHGSGTALLKAAVEDTKAFEEDVVKHLKIELGDFLNRPKSISSRFFTRLGKAFCFC